MQIAAFLFLGFTIGVAIMNLMHSKTIRNYDLMMHDVLEISAECNKTNSELLEMNEKLVADNGALKNRCRTLTHGSMCFFCPMECDNRSMPFRGEEK